MASEGDGAVQEAYKRKTCAEARGIFLTSDYRCGACALCEREGVGEERIDPAAPCGFFCDCLLGWAPRWEANGRVGLHDARRYDPRRLAGIAGRGPSAWRRNPRAAVRRAALHASFAVRAFQDVEELAPAKTLRRVVAALVAYERALERHPPKCWPEVACELCQAPSCADHEHGCPDSAVPWRPICSAAGPCPHHAAGGDQADACEAVVEFAITTDTALWATS